MLTSAKQYNPDGVMNSHITEILQKEGTKDINGLLISLQQQFPDDGWTLDMLKKRLQLQVSYGMLVSIAGQYHLHPRSLIGMGQAYFYGNGT